MSSCKVRGGKTHLTFISASRIPLKTKMPTRYQVPHSQATRKLQKFSINYYRWKKGSEDCVSTILRFDRMANYSECAKKWPISQCFAISIHNWNGNDREVITKFQSTVLLNQFRGKISLAIESYLTEPTSLVCCCYGCSSTFTQKMKEVYHA